MNTNEPPKWAVEAAAQIVALTADTDIPPETREEGITASSDYARQMWPNVVERAAAIIARHAPRPDVGALRERLRDTDNVLSNLAQEHLKLKDGDKIGFWLSEAFRMQNENRAAIATTEGGLK